MTRRLFVALLTLVALLAVPAAAQAVYVVAPDPTGAFGQVYAEVNPDEQGGAVGGCFMKKDYGMGGDANFNYYYSYGQKDCPYPQQKSVLVGDATLPSTDGVTDCPEDTSGRAKYCVGKVADQGIVMRDNKILKADIYYPVDPQTRQVATGPFPVILTQTPYGKKIGSQVASSESTSTGIVGGKSNYLIQRGYINVVADIRGTGGSYGTFSPVDPQQGRDGAALVSWASQLARSTGKVGTLGPSYLGLIQYMTAANVGPGSALKAIFPEVAGNDLYRDVVFDGGIADVEFQAWYLGLMDAANFGNPFFENQNTLDATEIAAVEADHANQLYDWQATQALNVSSGGDMAYDEDYWQARTPRNMFKKIVDNGVTAFMVGGWYDLFVRGQAINYTDLQNAYAGRPVGAPMLPDQVPTGRYQLLMGPWYHTNAGYGYDMNALELKWFDRWLRDDHNGIDETTTPFHTAEVGTNRYTDVARYPFEQATPTTYYLGAGKTLSKTAPTLANSGTDTLVWTGEDDPCHRSNDIWAAGGLALLTYQMGQDDPCATDATADATSGPARLSYTSPAMTADTTLAGPITATVYATSTAPDTELIATVEDVSSTTAKELTAGALLGSFRSLDSGKTWTAPDGKPTLPYHPYTRASQTAVTTGAVTKFDIEVRPTFARIAAGHKIRVTIKSAETPHLLTTPPQVQNLLGGVYSIQRTSLNSSYVELPLAPASAFATPCSICP